MSSGNKIYVSHSNYDIFDSLNPILKSIPDNEMVEDNESNRLLMALGCIYSLGTQLREAQKTIDALNKKLKQMKWIISGKKAKLNLNYFFWYAAS